MTMLTEVYDHLAAINEDTGELVSVQQLCDHINDSACGGDMVEDAVNRLIATGRARVITVGLTAISGSSPVTEEESARIERLARVLAGIVDHRCFYPLHDDIDGQHARNRFRAAAAISINYATSST